MKNGRLDFPVITAVARCDKWSHPSSLREDVMTVFPDGPLTDGIITMSSFSHLYLSFRVEFGK